MKNVRNILNLFKIDKPIFEIIEIGFSRLIITKLKSLKELKTLIKYANATESLIYLVQDIEEAYLIDEEVLNLIKQIIIIIYHEN